MSGTAGLVADMDGHFPRYERFDPALPVWCVTPSEGRTIHRFFDTSPFSPSGRYMALTRFPYEDRLPRPGDAAEVVLVDLAEGAERVVAETRGWDTQLGAQAQWGADDASLFFNDVDTATWRPFAVRLNPETGERTRLDGTVYMVSPDGRWAASPCLRRTGRTQAGYGVIVPGPHVPKNRGLPDDDGVYLTNTTTGESRLLVSIREIVETAEPAFDEGERKRADFYGFHVKWNRRGDRLMFVLRWMPRLVGRRRACVVTMRADGSDPRIAVPWSLWREGGHHPDWCPDGDSVLMNLNPNGRGLEFVRVRLEKGVGVPLCETPEGPARKGTPTPFSIEVLAPGVPGSGHPTLHPNGRHILTDVYARGALAFDDGSVPIRLIDTADATETVLLRIGSTPPFTGPNNELRVDPHPAWDRAYQRIAINACPDGTRRVYVADLRALVAPRP